MFGGQSPSLDSDAAFGVKDSLVRTFHLHEPAEAPCGAPETARAGRWWSLDLDTVLAPA